MSTLASTPYQLAPEAISDCHATDHFGHMASLLLLIAHSFQGLDRCTFDSSSPSLTADKIVPALPHSHTCTGSMRPSTQPPSTHLLTQLATMQQHPCRSSLSPACCTVGRGLGYMKPLHCSSSFSFSVSFFCFSLTLTQSNLRCILFGVSVAGTSCITSGSGGDDKPDSRFTIAFIWTRNQAPTRTAAVHC